MEIRLINNKERVGKTCIRCGANRPVKYMGTTEDGEQFPMCNICVLFLASTTYEGDKK